MATQPMSMRLDTDVHARLWKLARRTKSTASSLAGRLIDEGLRMREFPGIFFRDGPGGPRAVVVGGPDVWEVVSGLPYADLDMTASIQAYADDHRLGVWQVEAALAYYGAYRSEIDEWIADNADLAERLYNEPLTGRSATDSGTA